MRPRIRGRTLASRQTLQRTIFKRRDRQTPGFQCGRAQSRAGTRPPRRPGCSASSVGRLRRLRRGKNSYDGFHRPPPRRYRCRCRGPRGAAGTRPTITAHVFQSTDPLMASVWLPSMRPKTPIVGPLGHSGPRFPVVLRNVRWTKTSSASNRCWRMARPRPTHTRCDGTKSVWLTHEQVHRKEEHDEDGTARAENLTSERQR